MRRHAVPILVGLMVLAAVTALRIADPVLLSQARFAVYDTYQRLAPRTYEPAPVRVIDIDEESIARAGQWPWPRTIVAQLVDRLDAFGVATIAFDIVFPEPDRTSPGLLAASWPDGLLTAELIERLRALPSHDEILADAFARAPVVAGFAVTDQAFGRPPLRRSGFAAAGTDPRRFLPDYPGAVVNLEILEQAASGNASFSVAASTGGVIRSIPLVQQIQGTIYPALTTESLRVAQGASTIVTRSSDASGEVDLGGRLALTELRVGAFDVPVTADGQIWVHYTLDRPERTIPAWRILEDDPDPAVIDAVTGTIAIIGSSAQGLLDLRSTPLNDFEPGVMIHAQALEQMILGHFLNRPDWADGAELAFVVVLGLILILLLPLVGAIWSAVIGAVAVGGAAAASWFAFDGALLLIDPVFPALGCFAIYVAETGTLFFRTERERGQVRRAFSHYLSPALVETLARHPDRLVLGGEIRRMTFLFSDIRDFTSIAESMSPQDLTQFINRYLTPMTHTILDHGGTIDKYMGDAIMAFWNAPIDDPDHARHAANGALAMIRRLAELNAQWAEEARETGRPFKPVRIGVGLNTGEALVGNMGSDQRFDYSVLGDSVNLASRLEGQSKLYRVPIIAGEQTALAVPELTMIELDLIRVKGKEQPERILGILGPDSLRQEPGYPAFLDRYQAMIEAYRAARFTEAAEALWQAAEVAPEGFETLIALYRARIEAVLADPPGPDWSPVYVADSK